MEKTSIKRIAVVGAESTGKTWLCENLAKHYNTVWVPEYAREYFNDSDIYNYTLNDLIIIAERQIQMENEALGNAKRFLFCDTTLITLKIWAELEFNCNPKEIAEGIESSNYDLFLITDNSVEWQPDNLRQNKHSRDMLLKLNLQEVERCGAPYFIVEGSGEQRLFTAIEKIDTLFPL